MWTCQQITRALLNSEQTWQDLGGNAHAVSARVSWEGPCPLGKPGRFHQSPALQGPKAPWGLPPPNTKEQPLSFRFFKLKSLSPQALRDPFLPPKKSFLRRQSHWHFPTIKYLLVKGSSNLRLPLGLCFVDFHIIIRVVVFFHGFPDGWKQQDVSNAVYFHTSSCIFEHGLEVYLLSSPNTPTAHVWPIFILLQVVELHPHPTPNSKNSLYLVRKKKRCEYF